MLSVNISSEQILNHWQKIHRKILRLIHQSNAFHTSIIIHMVVSPTPQCGCPVVSCATNTAARLCSHTDSDSVTHCPSPGHTDAQAWHAALWKPQRGWRHRKRKLEELATNLRLSCPVLLSSSRAILFVSVVERRVSRDWSSVYGVALHLWGRTGTDHGLGGIFLMVHTPQQDPDGCVEGGGDLWLWLRPVPHPAPTDVVKPCGKLSSARDKISRLFLCT